VARPTVRDPAPPRSCQASFGRHPNARAIAGPAGEGPGDEPLGGVEEAEAGLERGLQDPDGPILVPIGGRREPHAAQGEPLAGADEHATA
jgi:hypothetical protein